MEEFKPQNTSSEQARRFDKELNKDISDYHLPDNEWIHGRNVINNSATGDLGKIGNEPSNLFCVSAPYPIIGVIHLESDKWAIFSTDEINSEIGFYQESGCIYKKIINDKCLNFSKTDLIKGVSRETSNCSHILYWADNGRNPDRILDIGDIRTAPYAQPWPNVPYVENCTIVNSCNICTPVIPYKLDCDKIRLSPLMKPLSLKMSKGAIGGELLNGSYFVLGAYTIKNQRITDYFVPSNIQALFSHTGIGGSLTVTIESADTDFFDQFELVVVSIINQQVSARKLGIYSTKQSQITIDILSNELVSIPVEQIPIRNNIHEKSDAIYSVNDYLIRVGPYSTLNFNYQPLANQIVTKWQSVEYPADYYVKGGNKTGYMRDEVYSFFIRWRFTTGDVSESYHIPGRPGFASDFLLAAGVDSSPEVSEGITPFRWIVENTAQITSINPNVSTDDGGKVIEEGYMGYWESTELYPDNKPEIWNANIPVAPYSNTSPLDYDLCGKPIRHHRFPDNDFSPNSNIFSTSDGGLNIRIMGVKFENIRLPIDNNGIQLTNIAGYEILVGSRKGNRTVIAKGIINNTVAYDIPDNITNRKGIFQNYPYNDIQGDKFLSKTQTSWNGLNCSPKNNNEYTANDYSKSIFTFHSPETQFANPFLSSRELKVYQDLDGVAEMRYQYPADHPKHKLMKDMAWILAGIAGLGAGVLAATGKTTREYRVAPGALGIGTVAPYYSSGANIGAAYLGLGDNTYYGATVGPLATDIVFSHEMSGNSTVTPAFNIVFQGVTQMPIFSYYWAEGAESVWRLIKAAVGYRQYALQQLSHCFYNNSISLSTSSRNSGERRRIIEDISYLDNQYQDFGASFRVNNLHRSKAVVLQVRDILNPPIILDNSRYNTRIKDIASNNILYYKNPERSFRRNSSTYYAALKQRIRNQYGQISSISQIPISPTIQIQSDSITFSSGALFGGDTYINRYTEKNTFFYFYDWLQGQPDGTEFDYLKYRMLPYPTYWANTEEFDIMEGITTLVSTLNPLTQFVNTVGYGLSLGGELIDYVTSLGADPINPGPSPFETMFNGLVTPSDYHVLDRPTGIWPLGGFTSNAGGTCGPGFVVKHGYFYLFNSGVRDFFVESEYNLAYRDWGDNAAERHYDEKTYSSLPDLFRTDIIKRGNYYKYDTTLSIAKNWYSYINWGNTQSADYNPLLAETCYQYKPDRIIYSLPSQFEATRDNWRIFLTNNYKDFLSRVTTIKSINKSGALIMLASDSPLQFQGLDQLETSLNTKLTIGDGGLFTQPFQNIVNTDRSYEYASCQDSLSVINTPAGVFWMSQNQGKIFQLLGNIKEISNDRIKWWLARYLPYQLIKYFPGYNLIDNPVAGIGCQAIYDNENGLVYFTKKDYIPKNNCLVFDPVTQLFYLDLTLCNGAPQIPKCPPGYTYDITLNQCVRVIDYVQNPVCPQGYTYDPENQTCTLVQTTSPVLNSNTLDLAIVIDNSQSVSFSELGDFKNFIQNLITGLSLQIDNCKIKVTIIEYNGNSSTSSCANVVFTDQSLICGAGSSVQLINVVSAISTSSGETNTACGLCRAYQELYGPAGNPSSDKKIILFTDGVQNCPVNTCGQTSLADVVQFIKAAGTDISVVGLGDPSEIALGLPEWTTIASSPSQVYTSSYTNILTILSTVINQVFYTCPGLDCTQTQTPNGIVCTCTYVIPANLQNCSGPNCEIIDLPNGNAFCRCTIYKDPTYVNFTIPVDINDPNYFEDASWTLSYDPKQDAWLGWHDWHPDLMIPGKNTFMTIKNILPNDAVAANGIWIHNKRCDSYCNYYGTDYPFEIEYMVNTVTQVNTLRSIEYQLEVYKYNFDNCYDRFHILDANFDEAIVYNTEQCSGLLRLNLSPKNNAPAILAYPIVNPTSIDILFSKEENKYRFNQFWDITADRGEFNLNAQRTIWNTPANGYAKVLNPNNLNYNKDVLQRKKFRHYTNSVFLRKKVSGDNKMLMSIAINKNLLSPR